MSRLLAGEVGNGGEGDGSNANAAAAAVAEAASRLARRHLGIAEQLAAEKKAEKAAATATATATATEAAATAAAGRAPDAEASASAAPPSLLAAAVRSLVAATLAHPRSKELYGSFPVTSKGWRRLPRVYGSGREREAGAGAASSPPSSPPSSSPPPRPPPPPPLPPALVAIDCEMVETGGGKKTDLARVAIAASIPLCWFEEEEEEEDGDGGRRGSDSEDDSGSDNGDKSAGGEGGEKEEAEAANGNEAPSPPPPPPPPPPPKQLLSPLEASSLSLKKAGYGPPHLVLSAAVAPSRKVSDWRSHITGLSRCSLSAAPMTRSEAQRAVVAAVARASGWSFGEERGGGRGGSPSPSPEQEQEPVAAAAADSPPPPSRRLPAPAVLVGHALHHDLRALRLDAASGSLVVDTALLYGYEGLPRATPGLADLYSAVVGRGCGGKGSLEDSVVAPLRSPGAPHDCAADAMAALALAAEALAVRIRSSEGDGGAAAAAAAAAAATDTGGRITVPAPARKVERDELCRLLVHGLKPPPRSRFDAVAAVAALFETMPAGVARPRSVEAVAAAVAPSAEKESGEGAGAAKSAKSAKTAAAAAKTATTPATKAWAVFASPAEADAAFAALPLPTPGSPSSASVATDSLGRPQRLARIPAAVGNGNGENLNAASSSSSQIVRVRKAAAHAGMSHGKFKPAKRDRSAASVRHGREQKMRKKSG